MGSARKQIVLFCPTGLAFKKYETRDFFTEMLKRCSQEKYEEGKKQKKGEDPTGLAFKDYEAGDFLKEILRNFEKVLPRRQETEKGGRYQRILH